MEGLKQGIAETVDSSYFLVSRDGAISFIIQAVILRNKQSSRRPGLLKHKGNQGLP